MKKNDIFIFDLYRNIKLKSFLKRYFMLNNNDEYKNFGKEELEVEERIIIKASIPIKDNFFDYY